MAFKFFAILAIVGVASASLTPLDLGYNAEPVLVKTIEEYDSHPQYTYNYGVEDSISGDSKSLTETREGDVVHGEYSLNDADGYRRTVKYTADAVNGFNAVVDRKPLVEAVPVAVKSVEHVKHAPVVVKAIEPVHAPVAVKTVEHYAAPAPVIVRTVEPAAAPLLVKTFAPATYSAPTVIKSIPLTYSAPNLIKSGPITYTSPIQFKSVPETYVIRSSLEPTLAYNSGPAIHKSVGFGYSAPSLLKSAPIAITGSAVYTKALPSISQW